MWKQLRINTKQLWYLLCISCGFSDTVITAANEVCEGNVFTGVCLSTGWGRARQGACVARGRAWQGRCAWPGGMRGRGACHTCPPPKILRDTVNERILLECILVYLICIIDKSGSNDEFGNSLTF